ncbi:MAG: hypothetical protein RJB01_602 [Actinomycetota bacterium]
MTSAACVLVDTAVSSRGQIRLRPTSLTIEANTITGIIGANGSGKSTLLSVLAGQLIPTQGAVHLNGHELSALKETERAQQRALLGQHVSATFAFPVREVVSWGRFCWARTEQRNRDLEVVQTAIERYNLQHLVDRPITELSSGEQTRVHLARVMAQQAPVIMLDEPDADLDLKARLAFYDSLREFRDRGATVVMITHDLGVLNRLCDSVIGMRDGGIAFHGGEVTPEVIVDLFGVTRSEAEHELGLL